MRRGGVGKGGGAREWPHTVRARLEERLGQHQGLFLQEVLQHAFYGGSGELCASAAGNHRRVKARDELRETEAAREGDAGGAGDRARFRGGHFQGLAGWYGAAYNAADARGRAAATTSAAAAAAGAGRGCNRAHFHGTREPHSGLQ